MSDADVLSRPQAGTERWELAGQELSSRLILAETCAGLRPGTPDNGPIVGGAGSGVPGGVLLATGHYRNGILMSAATADAIVACLTGQPPAAEWEPFGPGRFLAGEEER